MMANNSNKGSLLVFPRIDVSGRHCDTLITLVNDSSIDVNVKCYYRTSEPLPTPMSSKIDVTLIKHTMDFTFTLTTQPDRHLVGGNRRGARWRGGRSRSRSRGFPDGRPGTTGELKCFAVGTRCATATWARSTSTSCSATP